MLAVHLIILYLTLLRLMPGSGSSSHLDWLTCMMCANCIAMFNVCGALFYISISEAGCCEKDCDPKAATSVPEPRSLELVCLKSFQLVCLSKIWQS